MKTVEAWTRPKVLTEEGKTVDCYMSQQGIMRAKLKAPEMLRVLGDTIYVEFPKKLHVDFYNDSTKIIESWLDANYGKYFENLDKVYLRDSVVVINTKGDTLRTSELWWDQNTKLLYTDKVAFYDTRDQHYVGDSGMEAEQDLRRITFKYLTGTIITTENGPPK